MKITHVFFIKPRQNLFIKFKYITLKVVWVFTFIIIEKLYLNDKKYFTNISMYACIYNLPSIISYYTFYLLSNSPINRFIGLAQFIIRYLILVLCYTVNLFLEMLEISKYNTEFNEFLEQVRNIRSIMSVCPFYESNDLICQILGSKLRKVEIHYE